MAEKKGVGHAYNIDFLNVVFAASSLFLFLSVVWMVWDDYDRDWKNTQRRFVAARVPGDAGAARAGGARRRQEQAAAAPGAARRRREKNVAANQQKVDELQAQARRTSTAGCSARTQDYQFAKATYDQDRYDFEASRADGASSAEAKGAGGRRAREARSPS